MNVTKKSKTYAICSVMLAAGEPLTRVEILRRAHAFLVAQGMRVKPFRPTSNHCYFSPTGLGNGGQMSVVHRGLVRVCGANINKRTTLVYELTPAGKALVATLGV